MSNSDYTKLHQMGSDAADEAAKSSLDGSAMEFIKQGQQKYRRFIAERTVGFSDEWMWVWLGGFNARMLGLVTGDYIKLQDAMIAGLQALERKTDALKVG